MVASIGAYLPSPPIALYGVTKTAVVSLARAMANELGADGIRVNAIAPGLLLPHKKLDRHSSLPFILKRSDVNELYNLKKCLKFSEHPLISLTGWGNNYLRQYGQNWWQDDRLHIVLSMSCCWHWGSPKRWSNLTAGRYMSSIWCCKIDQAQQHRA